MWSAYVIGYTLERRFDFSGEFPGALQEILFEPIRLARIDIDIVNIIVVPQSCTPPSHEAKPYDPTFIDGHPLSSNLMSPQIDENLFLQ